MTTSKRIVSSSVLIGPPVHRLPCLGNSPSHRKLKSGHYDFRGPEKKKLRVLLH